MNFIDKVTIKDLENEQRELAELLGLENYLKLVKTFGGTSIYVHKVQTLERAIRDEQLRKEFKGNYKKLALKYGLSIRQTREIIDRKDIINEEQLKLF